MFGKNFKTSIGGLVGIFGGIGALGKCLGTVDFTSILTIMQSLNLECFSAAVGMIGVGIGLLFAKDHNVTGGTSAQ